MELVEREKAKAELLAQYAHEQQEMRDELARLSSERNSVASERAVGDRMHLEQQTKVGLHMQHNQVLCIPTLLQGLACHGVVCLGSMYFCWESSGSSWFTLT